MLFGLVACRSLSTPWNGVEQFTTVEVIRSDIDQAQQVRFWLAAQERTAVLAALNQARRLPAAVPDESAAVRYQLLCHDGTRRWQIHLTGQDLLRWSTDDPTQQEQGTRQARTPAIRPVLELAYQQVRSNAPPDQAGYFLERVVRSLQDQARRERRRLALIFVSSAQDVELAPGIVLALEPARWPIVEIETGRRASVEVAPAGLVLHPAYAARWLLAEPDGTLQLGGGPDHDTALDDPDPRRLQPYPAYFDLVLVDAQHGALLLIDIRDRALHWRND
jgi:hypothetical protein